MPDIFDRVDVPEQGKAVADIFDRVAPDKKPTGVGGFIQGAWDMSNPVPLIKALKQSGEAHPDLPPSIAQLYDPARNIFQSHLETGKKAVQAAMEGEPVRAFGYGLGTLLPVVGPAAVNAGESIQRGDTAYGLGQSFGLLAPFGVGAAVEAAAPKVAPLVEKAAQAQYANALRPTGIRARILTKDVVVPRALEEGTTALTSEGLLKKASAKKAVAKTAMDVGEQGIIDRQNAAQVLSKLTSQPPSTPVMTHPVQPMIMWLEDMRNGRGANRAPTRVNGVIVNPVKDAAITGYQNLLTDIANSDQFGGASGGAGPNANAISEGALLVLKRAIDDQVGQKHIVIPGTDTPAPLNVTRPLSNHLRAVFNDAHPDIAQAFRDFRFAKTFEMLAQRKAAATTGMTPLLTQVGTAGAMGFMDWMLRQNPTEAVAATLAFKTLHELSRSTGWRTISAVTKHNLSRAMANGQFALVNSILARSGLAAGAAGSDIENREQ